MAYDLEFGVSFREAIEGAQSLHARLANLGEEMDKIESSSGKASSAFSRHLRVMREASNKLEKQLIDQNVEAEEAGKVAKTAFDASARSLQSLANAHVTAAGKADAFRHRSGELAKVLAKTAQDNTYTSWQQKIAAMYQKSAGESRYLRKRLEELDSAQGRVNARLKAAVSAKERIIQAETRQAAKIEELRAEYERLDSAEGRQLEVLKLQVKERRRHVQELAKEQLGLETAAQAQERKSAGEEKSSRVLHRLSEQEARYEARLERVNSLIELRNKQTMEQARATNVMTNAQARQAEQMRENIALYQQQARYAAMTNAQLLGFAKSTDRVSRDMHLNAQAAAMFRAGLGGLNASIGIYTSATVLAASVTYALAAAFRDTITTGMEFTEMMSRAEAIMMTGTGSLTSAGDSMQALEMQVRALGQSTVFTATEVSSGLVDLGMAGLSAADAMRALKPSLDLASIGGVTMSKSADIATNVMTAFKLEASDLGGVVDILATAVSSSNTTIEQMANALSYVGPAAQAAGFDLKDTAAAIELLSNAGIKSSKAGTGLRRFMLNIQNPTSKGAKVLAEYGIGLQDATGNTRDLIDILGQFNTALHRDGITPSERMAAIVDLVGVRAASAVSRMVGSVDELGVFRRGLDEAAGAAEEMRQKIEDNLTADWKQVKSSFQDLQLEVFQEFQWHLRTTSAELTNFFQTLTVEGEDGVSELDEIIATMAKFGDVAQGALIAYGTFKAGMVGGTLAGAAASNLSALSDRMAVLNARTTSASTAQNLLAASFHNVSISMGNAWRMTQAYYASVRYARTATEGLTAAAGWLTAGLSGLATAASFAARALGWVGMVYGIYSAIKTAFSDTGSYVDAHKNRIESLRDEYERLGNQIELTQQKKNRAALEAQREADATELSAIDNQILDIKVAMGSATSADTLQALEDRLYLLRQKSEELQKSFTDTTAALTEMATSREELASYEDTFDGWTSTLADVERELDRLFQLRNIPSMTHKVKEQTAAWEEMRQVAQGYLDFATWRMDDLKQRTADYTQTLKEALDVQRQQLEEQRRFDQLSVTEKLIEKQQELSEIKATVAAMDASGTDKSLDVYKRQEAAAKELQEAIYELKWEYQDLASDGADSQQELIELQRNEKKSIEDLRAELAGLNADRMGMTANAVVSGQPIDVEDSNDTLKAMIGLLKQINTLAEENRKELAQAVTNSAEAYQGLLDAQNTEKDNLEELEAKLAGLNAQRMAMLANAVMSGEVMSADGINSVTELMEAQAKVLADITKLREKDADAMKKAREEGADAYATLLELQNEDKRSLQDLRVEMAGLNAQRMGMLATAVMSGGAFSTEDIEAITAVMKQQAEVLDLIGEKEEENRRKSKEAAEEAQRAREQRMSDANSLYEELRGDFDPIGQALDKYQDQMAMLDSLRSSTGDLSITQEEYNDAVGALSQRFRDNLTEMDPFLSRLREIRGEYLGFIEETQNQHKDRDWIQANMKGHEREMALDSWDDKRLDTLTSDMPKVSGISVDTGGPFSDLNNLLEEDGAQQDWFDEQVQRHQRMLEMKKISEQQYSADIRALTAERAKQIEQTEQQSQIARIAGYAEMFGNMAQLSATYAGDSAAITQSLVAFQQAANLAQTISAMATGQAKSFAELGPIAGTAKAVELAAMGASLVSTISSIAAPASPQFQTSNYSGMYDSGGSIPKGSYGIVGEVGPEIVHGPAQVTGRKATEDMRKGKGGDNLTISPVINVKVEGGNGNRNPQDDEKLGRAVGKQVEAQVMQIFNREMRPKGMLDRWKRS